MGRFARPLIVIVALQISWIGTVPSAAQRPAPAPTRVAIPPPRPFQLANASHRPAGAGSTLGPYSSASPVRTAGIIDLDFAHRDGSAIWP